MCLKLLFTHLVVQVKTPFWPYSPVAGLSCKNRKLNKQIYIDKYIRSKSKMRYCGNTKCMICKIKRGLLNIRNNPYRMIVYHSRFKIQNLHKITICSSTNVNLCSSPQNLANYKIILKLFYDS